MAPSVNPEPVVDMGAHHLAIRRAPTCAQPSLHRLPGETLITPDG